MIVGHCIHGLGLGGAQRVVAMIAEHRSEAFHHVVYSCEDGIMAGALRDADVPVRVIPRRLPKLDPTWIAALARWMRRDEVDVVHTHLFGDSLHGTVAARVAGGLPTVCTLHIGQEGLSPLQRRGYRWVLGRATRAVACSQGVAESFATLVPAGRLVTIANGVDLPKPVASESSSGLRSRLGLSGNEILIASVGRLVPQKGCQRLLRAFAEAVADRASLVFIGDGPLEAELRSLAAELRLQGRVHFTGALANAAQHLPEVDIVVFASRYEGLPMALLEAMAAGRCIVAVDIPGVREAVVPDREALLGAPQALGRNLRGAATDPVLRERLGTAALRRHQAEFAADPMVRRYECVYRCAAKGPP